MEIYDSHFTPAAARKLKAAIEEAKGNEVFARGILSEDGLICEIEIIARGNDHMVAAVMQRCKSGDYAIHNHPPSRMVSAKENIRPSDADVGIASQLGSRGIGSMIVDNDVRMSYVLVETGPMKKLTLLPMDKIVSQLDKGSRLSQHFKNYEERPEQKAMLGQVAKAFNDGDLCVAEAGTGTGKTIAYLLPAIAWSLLNNEKIVIATHTINLQEQLYKKDFPIVKDLFSQEAKAVLVKGRSNYACLRKANTILKNPELIADEDQERLESLAKWAVGSETGDRSEPAEYPENKHWEKISSSRETCIKSACPFFKSCFVVKARRKAEEANVIITNHALLFSDIAIREEGNATGILPDYGTVVIDEAHNLEDSASSHFGMEVSRYDILTTLNAIYRSSGHKQTGALITLANFVKKNPERFKKDQETILEQIKTLVDDGLPTLHEEALGECDDICDILLKLDAKAKLGGQDFLPYRLTKEHRATAEWEDICEHLKNLEATLTQGAALFKGIFEIVEDKAAEGHDELPGLARDLAVRVGHLEAFASTISEIREKGEEENGMVSWLDAGLSQKLKIKRFSMESVPITVGEMLKESLYKKFRTIILTSATLSSKEKLDFFKSRVGLDLYEAELAAVGGRKITENIYKSSFDYKKQAALLVPEDSYELNQNAMILDLAQLTEGGAFVLFTSIALMQKSYDALEKALRARGLLPMVQFSDSSHNLLNRFKSSHNAVLFGVDSFWAGVDVPGENLRSIILTKLPFAVPTEPIQEARCEELEKKGVTSFAHYSVPQAVIKLRQGFGRLVRSSSDYGIVTILDDRILRKSYGKTFLGSLPDCQRFIGPFKTVLDSAQYFLENIKKQK